MELVGVAADDVPLPDDETNVSVSTKKIGGCETTEFSLSSLVFKGIRTGKLVSALDGVLGIVGVTSPEPGNSSKVNLGGWMFAADDLLAP
jgi:hypothetical protein